MDADPVLRSRSHALVRRLRSLKERGPDSGLILIEGIRLLQEALASDLAIEEAAVSPRLQRDKRGPQLVEALRRRGVRVRRMEEGLLASLSELETSQGVLALARRPSFHEDQLFRGKALLVVLAGIQEPGNVGAILRTAEAAGATGAYLTAGTADPCSWKALRGAMGSAFRLPHVRQVPLTEALSRLEALGIAIVAAASQAERRYDEVDLRGPVAVLLGSEGAGLPPEALKRTRVRVSIPMKGGVESLNVAVAAGVLLFEAARQRRALSG